MKFGLILLSMLLSGLGCAPAPSTSTAQKTLFSNYWHCSNNRELALYLGQYGLPFSYTYTGVLNSPSQCVYDLTFNADGTYSLTKGCDITSGSCPDVHIPGPGPCPDSTGIWTLQNNTLSFSGNYSTTFWAFSGATCN